MRYLGTLLCKHGSMKGQMRERAAKGGQVHWRVMEGRSERMELMRGVKNSIILLTLIIFIRDVDMECTTAIEKTFIGKKLYKRCWVC